MRRRFGLADLWQVTGVDGEQLVTSQRQAARLLNMRPSSVFYWRQIGLLGPAPWTLADLLAVKHRADAPSLAVLGTPMPASHISSLAQTRLLMSPGPPM